MNAADRARIGDRIVTYLGKWLAKERLSGNKIEPFTALDEFGKNPLAFGATESQAENQAYCAELSEQKKLVLALLIERAAQRYARKEMSE